MPTPLPTHLARDYHRPGWATFLRPSVACLIGNRVTDSVTLGPKSSHDLACLASFHSARTLFCRYGNINPLSIDYACRPRLRSRLTLGGQTWPRNPWSIGGRDSHSAFATHACILTPTPSTAPSQGRFTGCRTLPYPTRTYSQRPMHTDCHSFGGALEPRYIVGAGPLDQ